MTNAERQALVDQGRAGLLMLEEALAAAGDEPFGDPKCDRRLRRIRRQVQMIHEDLEDCISTGDPTVQFGGGK